MADRCDDTTVAAIENGFVNVLRTAQMATLVGFDDDLSKKSISIGADITSINLPNDTIITHLNYTPVLHGGSNFLLSTAQAREFGAAVHEMEKFHGGKQYINPDNRVNRINFDKALVYVPIHEPTQW